MKVIDFNRDEDSVTALLDSVADDADYAAAARLEAASKGCLPYEGGR